MQCGEIYLASFPYGDVAAMKLRPVLLMTGPVGVGTEIIVAYISSVIPNPLLASDIIIDPQKPEHQSTRLKNVSVIRLHKLATIHTTSVQRYLGNISAAIQQEVDAKLRRVLSL